MRDDWIWWAGQGNMVAARRWIKRLELAEEGSSDLVRKQTAKEASEALSFAARHGRQEMVELLLGKVDASERNSQALRWAAENGHMKIVELLLHASDPKASGSDALIRAAENGHADIVKLLIPVSEPRAGGSRRCAARRKMDGKR